MYALIYCLIWFITFIVDFNIVIYQKYSAKLKVCTYSQECIKFDTLDSGLFLLQAA